MPYHSKMETKKKKTQAFPRVKKEDKNPGGRPLELNDELIQKIANNLRAGAYVETAVIVAGCPKATFYSWMKRAHDENETNPLYKRLLDTVERAIEEAEMRDIVNIDQAAMGRPAKFATDANGKIIYNERGRAVIEQAELAPDWTASAWRLERKNPKRWAKTEKHEHKVADNSIEVNFVDEDPDKDKPAE